MTLSGIPARRGREPVLSTRLLESLALIAGGALIGIFWREAMETAATLVRLISSRG